MHEGDVRDHAPQGRSEDLAVATQTKSGETVSNYLLSRLGLAGSRVRSNARNETVALGFRDISRLAVVDEERMHARISPIESGRPQTRTKELSVLKLLLQGHDDSDLIGGDDPVAFGRRNRAQLSVLERAIAQALEQLATAPTQAECAEGLQLVRKAIDFHTESVANELEATDDIVEGLKSLTEKRREANSRAEEAEVLRARFSLLESQYGRDLDRLGTVLSAGSLLRYFDSERCVYCGARTEDQHPQHAEYETNQLRQAIDAEIEQTTALREDLGRTLTALAEQQVSLNAESSGIFVKIRFEEGRLAALEKRTTPHRSALSELLARQSELERWAENWRHVDDLVSLSRQVAKERPTTSESIPEGLSYSAENELSFHLRSVLSAWNVPGGDSARFVAAPRPEIVIDGRRRQDRGEGMRSVLHAGFSTALAEYCVENELPHPGFLVLDTPMLTYRDADVAGNVPTQDSEADENPAIGEDVMPETVSRAFYEYLTASPFQAVVLENQTPPVAEGPGCKMVYFSGNESVGRAGFYPESTLS